MGSWPNQTDKQTNISNNQSEGAFYSMTKAPELSKQGAVSVKFNGNISHTKSARQLIPCSAQR